MAPSTAEALTGAARDWLDRHPGQTPSRSYRRVLEDNPDLARRHHRGDPGAAAPPPRTESAVDPLNPGALLCDAANRSLASGECATFAEAFALAREAHPSWASAHHEGRMVEAPRPPTFTPPAPIERFRTLAAFEAATLAPRTGTITGAEIFSTGTHNGKTYTLRDLHQMVDAFGKVGFRPTIKLGHSDAQELAHGYVSSIYVEGEKLLADFEAVPQETMEHIKSGRILTVSVEIYNNLPRNNHTFPRVLRAVALLGTSVPGVSYLRPLAEALA